MADWYVKSNEELAAWWANFTLRRTEFEAKYAILGTLKSELIAIGAWVDYWVGTRNTFDDMSKQLSKYFNDIAGNDPLVDPPSPITWTLPPGTPAEVPTGIEKFIRDVRREVVGLTNYSKADGAGLGFEATAPASLTPAEVKPGLQAFASAHDYGVALVITGRNGATIADVYLLRKGGTRTKYATIEGKSGNITITPTVPGDAEQVQVDVQLRKNNADYGQPSNPVWVTVNP